MKVELHRMLGPITTPIVVEVDFQGFVLLIHAVGEQRLDARVFGIRNMRADIEEEAALVTERRGMTSMIVVFVVDNRSDAFAVELEGSAETRHSGTQDNDVLLTI